MNKEKNNLMSKIFPYLVIVGLILVILNLKGCFDKKGSGETLNINGKKYEVIKKEIDTLYETKTHTLYKKGKDIYHEVEVVKEIPAKIDTLSILKNYYSKVFYRDTFKLKDSLGYFVINDTISKNRIHSRNVASAVRIPTIKEKIYLRELTRDFYLGPAIQIGNSISLGADAHLKNKKDVLFGFGVGVNSSISPYVRGSFSWKINK
jgi:hypothetical protein